MSETPNIKLSYWCCDQCCRNLRHGEFRFNCTVCENYDLCEQCFTTLNPPHPHRMMRELAYGSEDTVKLCEHESMANGIQTATIMYRDRYCLGIRDLDKANQSLYADTYSWLTFETVGNRSKYFGQGLRNIIESRGYLGICAANRPEWVIADFACILQSIITVPMYCLLNESELAYIINNTQISVVVCDKQMLFKFIRLSVECPSFHHIVCMDPIPEAVLDMEKNGLYIHQMSKIETDGLTQHYESIGFDPNDCVTIIYTSGSSGFPKGAMISENAYRTTYSQWCKPFCADLVYFSYEPLAWATGRDAIIRTFFGGGRTGFSTGDISRLMEDVMLVRPNNFSTTPAIWNKIYAEFKTALSLRAANYPPEAGAQVEKNLLEQFSKLIPTRCKTITVGGAMTSPAVFDFIKRCFSPRYHIYESYGITECGSIAINNIINSSLQFRLVSVPEMNYTIDDEPFARGELLIKSEEMFSGYFNNSNETHTALTEDGFFRTGDIVELRFGDDNEFHVYVIDRKKNFFKLSQGQYVSPEFLQNIYIQSPFIEQIYIHGDLLADAIVAVIVPNREYVQSFINQHHLENFDMTNPDQKLYDVILRDIQLLAEKESLRKHEIPSKIIIDFESFTPENGLLTSTRKLCRPKLAGYYGSRLRQSNTIEQRLKSIIETTTKQSIIDNEENNFFIPTGGDSLTAIRLARQIENDLGISVSSRVLLQPNMTLQRLLTVINDPSQISSTSYSILQQLCKDSELLLDIKIDKHKNIIGSHSMIFITGTTGFIGAFLLAELLLNSPPECKFICLVRCQSVTNPLDRIRKNMLFHKIWKEDFQERIIPLKGDLEKDYFGLDLEKYQSLASQIDVIFHCGATVNFVLPYSKLYGSNVIGTREIIRLATYATTCIPVHYISTISVLSNNVNEEVSINEISPADLTNGYAQSKWVAEKLIATASLLGLPVVVYRLGLICASTETGACNPNDLCTFLFAAILKLGCYPETIMNARFHALPVNFTAQSIAYLSRGKVDAFGKNYHVLNPNSEILFKNFIHAMCHCGVQLKSVSLEEWRMKLKILSYDDSSMEYVDEFFNEDFFQQNYTISAKEFCNAIFLLNFPSLDESYLMKWIKFVLENISGR